MKDKIPASLAIALVSSVGGINANAFAIRLGLNGIDPTSPDAYPLQRKNSVKFEREVEELLSEFRGKPCTYAALAKIMTSLLQRAIVLLENK